MKVERYVAADMRQALRLVRDAMGPDAVILSNKRVAGGVEVIAAEYYDENMAGLARTANQSARQSQTGQKASAETQSEAVTQPGTERQNTAQAAPQRKDNGQEQIDSTFEHLLNQLQKPAAISPDQELMFSMRSEIEHLRLLLKDQLKQSSRERWTLGNPLAAEVSKRLQKCGMNEREARRLALRSADRITTDEAWSAALQALQKELPIADDLVMQGGVIAVTGPTGAGKTTTIAKLAVRYAMAHGRDKLALITTDTHRLAAYDQLRTLARIIDVPVRRIDAPEDLRPVLRAFRDKSLILIDMPGLAADSGPQAEILQLLTQINSKAKKLLVLPSGGQYEALLCAYRQASVVDIDACVITKADEAGGFGQVLSLVLEKHLPVAYITNGCAIPDNIQAATAQWLIERLIQGGQVTASIHTQGPRTESVAKVYETVPNNKRRELRAASRP